MQRGSVVDLEQARRERIRLIAQTIRKSGMVKQAAQAYVREWKYVPPPKTTRLTGRRARRASDVVQLPQIETEIQAFANRGSLTPSEQQRVLKMAYPERTGR